MTSEPDGRPRRRPPTIDLTATESEPPGSTTAAAAHATSGDSGSGASAPRGNSSTGIGRYAAGVTIGAVLVGALAFGVWVSGLVPARNAPSAAANGDAGRAISAQLDKIEAELQSRPADTALAARVANLEAQAKALSDSLAGITRRLDEVAVAAQAAGQRAAAAADAAKTAAQNAGAAADTAKSAAQNASQSAVQRSDLDALAARITALEGSIKTLSAAVQRPASTLDRAARAAIAAEALRAAVERGAPYQAELAAMKSLGADPNATAQLEPFAAGGIPSAAELAHELSQLVASLRPASAPAAAASAASGGGFLGRIEKNAKSLVRVTPVNAPAADASSSVVARLAADAARADIGAALADIGGLPPAQKALAQPWVAKANARAAAIAASQRIVADALARLASTGADTQ
jgi:hypothetical protein